MFRRCLFTLLVLLVAPAAFAQDANPQEEGAASEDYGDYEGEEPTRSKEVKVEGPMERSSRFTLQAGWRYAPNTKFFDDYYARRENRTLTRADGTFGGPLVAGTFAYCPLEWVEVGMDAFFTYERMAIAAKPEFNAITFGLMFGLRAQHRLVLSNKELIPFVGVLSGPTFAASYFAGGRSVENFNQAVGLTAGATLRLTAKWGVNFDYRLTFANGEAEQLGTYNAGGSWFSVGLTYIFPKKVRDRPLKRGF